MEVTFRLSLPREAASVPVVRRLCRCSFRSLGIDEDCSHDLELVVTEACTNVLKHASGNDQYEVEVRTSGEACDIQVSDKGGGFDHGLHGLGQANVSDEGGRGIHLMRVLVDRLQFVSAQDSGTMVHLNKRVALRPDSPLRPSARRDGSTPAAPRSGR
jgi:serine/threonine-protein kinase RsbW